MKKAFRKKGFTLIELLVVSTIIAVLSAIGIASFVNAGKSARDAKRKADLETVRQALVLYRSDSVDGKYPSVGSATPTVVSYTTATSALIPDYLSNPVPQDPKDTDPYLYKYGSLNGTEFTITAVLEKTATTYEVENP